MRRFSTLLGRFLLVTAAVLASLGSLSAHAATVDREAALKVFPEADDVGEPGGSPRVTPVEHEGALIGWVFSSYDAVRSVGYSGKKLDLLIGLDRTGTITGVHIIEQTEPIMVTGATASDLEAFAQGFVGLRITDSVEVEGLEERKDGGDKSNKAEKSDDEQEVEIDAVSGATITSLVISDAILGAARAVAASQGLIAAERVDLSAHDEPAQKFTDLLNDGSLARLTVTVGEFTSRLERRELLYPPSAAWQVSPDTPALDLYAGIVTPPRVGRSLLGQRDYDRAMAERGPGEQLLFIGGSGLLSFKGQNWRKTGSFDRLVLAQGDTVIHFSRDDYRLIESIAAGDAPTLRESGLFVIRAGKGFAPDQPFELRVLVPAESDVGEEKSLTLKLTSQLPERYLLPPPPASEPLWRQIWSDRIVEVIVLSVALIGLTGLFFFQDWFVRRRRLATGIRIFYLLFTLGFLGFHARAQLSVVNILSFANVLIDDFQWEYFLVEPLIFILWVGVVVGLLFWGRGPFCGWLCPFGALQELLNRLAKLARVPQLSVPWGLHVRLWPIKYVVFMGLLGISLYSFVEAERLAEIEPFKTAIVLHFLREWPFVVFAGGLLFIGLFVERAFCRYLCPLGAALAIPGKMRIFEWLLRHKECGSPCQRCAEGCMVQAIHPDGHINPNECLYCLHCQMLYYDEHACPTMIQRRQRRERREALSSPDFHGAPQRRKARAAATPDDPTQP